MTVRLKIRWCTQAEEARPLADFFVRNVTPEYISHGEIQVGRADDVGCWSPDLLENVAAEIHNAVLAATQDSDKRVLTAHAGGKLVALAVVSFQEGHRRKYGILEDLVVATRRRGQGIGAAVLQWIEDEARRAGVSRLFLESGLKNQDAHAFFEREGFRACSITMTKALDGRRRR